MSITLALALLQTPIVFAHANVVDGRDPSPRRDQTVVVQGTRIVAAGPSTSVRVPAGSSVIDARGKYLIPGLWDMHVHTTFIGGRDLLPLYVANGVTGVRDMAGDWDTLTAWRGEIARGTLAGPRMIVSGPYLEGGDVPVPHILTRTPEEGRAGVDSLVKLGVDFIKVHDWLSRESYLAIATEARRRGSYVAGHLPIAVDPVDAVRARQRSIEHMGNGWSGLLLFASADRHLIDSVSKWANVEAGTEGLTKHFTRTWQRRLADSFSPSRARALCSQLAVGRVWLTPTTYFTAYLTLMPLDHALLRDPRLNYLPQSVRDVTQYVVPAERFARAARTSPNVSVYEVRARLIRICRDQGVQFLAGSDTGPYGPMIPGFSLHDELARLVADGFTPIQALRAATINPARFFNATDTLGTVAGGKRADLVLLDANPLSNINNVRRINAVIANGILVDSTRRQTMLDSLAAAFATR